jgi:hypothetical protein
MISDQCRLTGSGRQYIEFDFLENIAVGGPTPYSGLPARQWLSIHDDQLSPPMRAVLIHGTSARLSTLTMGRYIGGSLAAAQEDWMVHIYRLSGSVWELDSSTPFVASATVFTQNIATTAYYAIEVCMPNDLTAGGASHGSYELSLQLAGTCDTWLASEVPDLTTHLAELDLMRINAASLLISPVVQASDRCGNVSAVQLEEEENWLTTVGAVSNALGPLASRPDCVTQGFTKGAYGYLKPSSTASFKERQVVHRNRLGAVLSVQEQLFVGCDTIAFHITVPPNGVSGTYPASLVQLTRVIGMEYNTTSSWAIQTSPKTSSAEFARMVEALRRMPQFFENETHFEALMRYLRAGVKGAITYGPTVLSILRIIAGAM